MEIPHFVYFGNEISQPDMQTHRENIDGSAAVFIITGIDQKLIGARQIEKIFLQLGRVVKLNQLFGSIIQCAVAQFEAISSGLKKIAVVFRKP